MTYDGAPDSDIRDGPKTSLMIPQKVVLSKTAPREFIPGCAQGRSDMLSEDFEQTVESCGMAVSA